MTTCPKCSHRVSETADQCPSCGENFAARRRQEAVGHALALAVLLLLIALAGLIILSPGIVINVLRGRYRDRSGNILLAAMRDWQTWLIALPIAAAAFMASKLGGTFG